MPVLWKPMCTTVAIGVEAIHLVSTGHGHRPGARRPPRRLEPRLPLPRARGRPAVGGLTLLLRAAGVRGGDDRWRRRVAVHRPVEVGRRVVPADRQRRVRRRAHRRDPDAVALLPVPARRPARPRPPRAPRARLHAHPQRAHLPGRAGRRLAHRPPPHRRRAGAVGGVGDRAVPGRVRVLDALPVVDLPRRVGVGVRARRGATRRARGDPRGGDRTRPAQRARARGSRSCSRCGRGGAS